AGAFRRLPQGPLRPRLSAGAGEARALSHGRFCRCEPPAGAAARSRPGCQDRRYIARLRSPGKAGAMTLVLSTSPGFGRYGADPSRLATYAARLGPAMPRAL